MCFPSKYYARYKKKQMLKNVYALNTHGTVLFSLISKNALANLFSYQPKNESKMERKNNIAVICYYQYNYQNNEIQTVPSCDADTNRFVIHWHIDKSVTSPSCVPTSWTPSMSLSKGHLGGSSATKVSPFPTFEVSILRTYFPMPTIKISCMKRLNYY